MKQIRIEYTLKSNADLALVKQRITQFVSALREHRATKHYTSFQHAQSPLRFTHVGAFDEAHIADLQAQPWFGAFTAFLREHAEVGPEVAQLVEVASTGPR
jgi:hypothetical protein